MSKRWWGKKTVIYEGKPDPKPVQKSFVDSFTPAPEPVEQEPEPTISGDQNWRYEVLQSFPSPEFQCNYRLGRTYSFRTKDADHPDCDNRRLLAILPTWVDEGKVKMLE